MNSSTRWTSVRLAPLSRRRALVILASLVVGLELWAATAHIGHIARTGYRALVGPSRPVQEADLDPLAFYALTGALIRARSIIPPGATYAVVVSPKLTSTQRAAALAFKLVLLPRIFTTDRHRADWVIAYDTPSEGLGIPYSKEIGLAPDVNIVKAARPSVSG
jgi:hypothetical protein